MAAWHWILSFVSPQVMMGKPKDCHASGWERTVWFFVPHIQVSADFTPQSRTDYLKNRDWHSEVQPLTHPLDNSPIFASGCMEVISHLKRFLQGWYPVMSGGLSVVTSIREKKSQFQATKKDLEKDLPAAVRVSSKGQCCHQVYFTFPSLTLLWQTYSGCGCKDYENLKTGYVQHMHFTCANLPCSL